MKIEVGRPLGNNSSEKKMGASKTNLQVCSILLAAISLSLKISDFSKMFNPTMVLFTISLMLAIVCLTIAIFLEADAVFYYSREYEKLGDYLDRYGYQIMRYGLLCVLIVLNYLGFSLIQLQNFISLKWSVSLQAWLPAVFGFISFFIWRIFKSSALKKEFT